MGRAEDVLVVQAARNGEDNTAQHGQSRHYIAGGSGLRGGGSTDAEPGWIGLYWIRLE